MRRGEIGAMMYWILAIIGLLVIIGVVLSFRDQSTGIIDRLRELLR